MKRTFEQAQEEAMPTPQEPPGGDFGSQTDYENYMRNEIGLSPRTYKATEQYLDDEDWEATYPTYKAMLRDGPKTVSELLSALEDLRKHLRGKYYGG